MAIITDPDTLNIKISTPMDYKLTYKQYTFLNRMIKESWYPYDNYETFIRGIIKRKGYDTKEQSSLQELRKWHINHLEAIK